MSESYELVSVTVSSERTDPEYRYTVETSHLFESVEDDHTVIALDDLPAEVQSVLEEARTDSYSADELPDNTRTTIEEYDFVDFGSDSGRYRYVGFELLEVDLDTPPRLTVDARLLDEIAERDDPAVLEIEAENDGDETITWFTGAPRPFGILRADGLLLWTDAYEESGHVGIEDSDIGSVNYIVVGTELEPGESAAEEYEIQTDRDAFGPGEFTLAGELRTEFDGGRETITYSISWEIRTVNTEG